MKTITTIKAGWKHWIFPGCVLVATCFGVFVLPFCFPPPYLAGISVANVAGFNNKIAYISAALISALVFLAALKGWWVKPQQPAEPSGRLSRSIVLTTTAIFGISMTLVSWLVIRSHMRYFKDAGYFIEQISIHTDFGRKVYAQIDFPYGPFIFYGPVAVHSILSLFHVSLTWAYYITLIGEHIIGLLLVAYVIDNLPMLRKWKTLLFLYCALGAIQANLGLNYTFFRFIVPPAFLILASRRKQPWTVAAIFAAGESMSLALSPEMGIAFAGASVAYAAYFIYREGWAWLPAVAAPFAAIAGFLLIIDRSYLLMLKLFAKGFNSFIVEPLPHVLIFLLALVWLVPLSLASFFRNHQPEAQRMGALYIFSLGLLPAALGSVDPGHIFFNGLVLFFLSAVAITSYRRPLQWIWVLSVGGIFVWQIFLNVNLWRFEWYPTLEEGIFHSEPNGFKHAAVVFAKTRSLTAAEQSLSFVYPDHSFNINKLDEIIGNSPIATPLEVPLYVEEELKRAGQYIPAYYSFMFLYDATAEDRVITDLNESQWALLPKGTRIHWWEGPADTRFALGIQLPYRAKHDPYVIGDRFNENLLTHWQPYGQVGSYIIYRRR